MGCVALTSLIKTIEIEFVGQTPRVSLSLHHHHHHPAGIIKSFLENLSYLQAFLQEESSGDGEDDALKLRDLEIEIRDFAIKAEDDIELQLSNFILQHGGEKAAAFHQHQLLLHQTLQEAAKTATELLKSLKMGSATVALTILIQKIKHYFRQYDLVYGCDGTAKTMKYFSEKLSTLRGCLLQERNSNNSAAAIKILETKITNFALKTQDDLQIPLKNSLLANHTVHQQKASHKLHHTLQEAAESVQELLDIIKIRSIKRKRVDDDEANQTQPSNTWLKHVESDGSTSYGFVKPEGRMVGRQNDCRVIKDKLFDPYSSIPSIISIVGMVGIGKTTVARNVYEDPSVAFHFDLRAWVTIPPPQHYNKSGMLRQLLHSITPVEEPNVIKKGSTPHELQMQVRKCFCGKRYLIVLEDITNKQTWEQAWTDIKGCVYNGLRGCYILLTTRHCFNLDVRDLRYVYIHRMTLLDPKESWELFCNILSIDKEHLDPKFKKLGTMLWRNVVYPS